jgi:hypothetical protein
MTDYKATLASAMQIARAVLIVLVIAVAVLLVKFTGWGGKPPVRVERSDRVVEVHVETLGEYPTTIVHARLENEETQSTIWEIEAETGTPQLHELVSKEGENPELPADPFGGTYAVIVPANGGSFRLERGVDYRLELWRDANSSPARVSIRFPE